MSMAENQTEHSVGQEHGIFEPKQVELKKQPLTGKQLSVRIIIAASLVIIGLLAYFLLSDPYKRPVNKYYKGYSAGKPEVMAEAFPEWLRNAEVSDTTMTVNAMCTAMVTLKKSNYGENAEVQMGIIAESKVDEKRLSQIEQGIKSHYGVNTDVTEGKNLTLSVRYILSSGKEYSNLEYVTVYRIGGKWYMLDVASDQAPA